MEIGLWRGVGARGARTCALARDVAGRWLWRLFVQPCVTAAAKKREKREAEADQKADHDRLAKLLDGGRSDGERSVL